MNGPSSHLGTAYSFRHGNVEFFVVNEFEVRDGEVRVGVTGDQLRWLEDALDDSAADFRIVVGHAPVLPGTRKRSSSGLQVERGADSPLWDVMRRARVDAYFCGEVHDISFQKRDGVLQVVTGTQASNVPEMNYLVATVFDDRIELEIRLTGTTLRGPRDASLDPYGKDKYTQRTVTVSPEQQAEGWKSVGSMTLRRTGTGPRFDLREGVFISRWDDQDPASEPNDEGDGGVPERGDAGN